MLTLIIVLAIVAVAGLIIGSAGIKSNERYPDGQKFFRRIRLFIPLVAVLIIVISLVVSGISIVDSTQIGVVRTFGEINRQIGSGLNLVNPICDSVTIYDLTVHVREESFASYTKDAQPLTSAIEYQYSLIPERAMDVAREYGTYEVLESKIANVVQEKAKVVFARYSAMTLLENRSTLSAEVSMEMQELEDLYHIDFSSVIVKDIDFSDAFEASVEAKMTAEQDALRAEQEKKTALVKAEQAKEVAAIDAQAKKEAAVIEAEAMVAKAEGEARAEVARAEGEAKALDITRAALENMPETWVTQQYLQRWNGVLPQIMSDGSNLMISPSLAE